MKPSFDSLLGVLESRTPRGLVAPDAWKMIRQTAGRLAPVYRGGLECRLRPGSRRVDLHQCILQDAEEPRRLIEHIEQAGWAGNPTWMQILRFCRQWRRPTSSLHRNVAEIWLEFDILQKKRAAPEPSIFLQLRPPPSGSCIREDLIADLLAAMAPVAPHGALQSMQHAISRCATVCPTGARISHIGLMLARNQNFIRVNFKDLSARQWPQVLQEIDWPGSVSRLSEQTAPLMDRLAQMVLCLDVGRQTAPGVGLECMVHQGPDRENAWADLLDALVESGMCAPEKRNAILDWEKPVKPPDAPLHWPEDLIAESLLRGPDRFSVISQAINHMKIRYHPSRPPAAKAYLWFGHLWVEKKAVESSIALQNRAVEMEAVDES